MVIEIMLKPLYRCRSGQVRILNWSSGACTFNQFRSTIQNLWWKRDTLNIITECGERLTWFRANNTNLHPHLIERAGPESGDLISKSETKLPRATSPGRILKSDTPNWRKPFARDTRQNGLSLEGQKSSK